MNHNMKQLLKESPFFEEIFDGFSVTDCTVRDKNVIYFTTAKDYDYHEYKDFDDENFPEELLEKRLIAYFRDESIESALGTCEAYYLSYAMQCEMTYTPKPQCVATLDDEVMLVYGSGSSEIETAEETQATSGMKCIGKKVYLAQGRRRVHYRTDKETWQVLGDNDSHPAKGMFEKNADGNFLPREGDCTSNHLIADCGFRDIDGFDENHIYAVGGKGDVWRCVDDHWVDCQFPYDVDLTTVCCGGDGNVYISGEQGQLFVGKENDWETFAEPECLNSFKSMVWFDNTLWLASSGEGLWWVKSGRFEEAGVPSVFTSCSGKLSARDGVMVLANSNSVYLLENGEWQVLFDSYEETERYLP